jgi:TetR/AcrR family transcriptional repressor of nem operon
LDVRQRLIEAAGSLIHAGSYDAIDEAAICAHAEVEPARFAEFFDHKRDVAIAALEWQFTLSRQYILEPSFAPDVAPMARISRFFQIAYQANVAAQAASGCMLGCPFGNIVSQLGQREPRIRETVVTIFGGFCGYFKAALDEAVRAGEVTPHDTGRAAQALLAYFQGMMLMATAHGDAGVIGTLADFPHTILGLPFERL